jgi:ribonuclease D
LAAIRRGIEQPLAWEARPRRTKKKANRSPNGRPSPACQARFEALRSWRNATAESRGVEPDIIMTNQSLWEVSFRNPQNLDDLRRGNLLAPWQLDEFGSELLAVIKKGR